MTFTESAEQLLADAESYATTADGADAREMAEHFRWLAMLAFPEELVPRAWAVVDQLEASAATAS